MVTALVYSSTDGKCQHTGNLTVVLMLWPKDPWEHSQITLREVCRRKMWQPQACTFKEIPLRAWTSTDVSWEEKELAYTLIAWNVRVTTCPNAYLRAAEGSRPCTISLGCVCFLLVQLTPTLSLPKRTPVHLCETAHSYFKQAPALSRKAQTTLMSPNVGGKVSEWIEQWRVTIPVSQKHSIHPTLAINLTE